MATVRGTRGFGLRSAAGGRRGAAERTRGGRRQTWRVAALGLAAGLLAGAARQACGTTYYWLGGVSGNGTWDNVSTDLYWDDSASNHSNLGWTLLNTANPGAAVDAQFLGTGATSTVTLTDTVNPVVVNSMTIGSTAFGGKYAFAGTAEEILLASGYTGSGVTAPNATTGELVFSTTQQSATFQPALSTGASPFVIVGNAANYLQQSAASGLGVTLGANTNTFGGGVLITGGPVDLQISNNAASNTVNTSAYVANGTTYGGVLVTAFSGTSPGSYPTVTIDADGSGITMAGTKTGAQNVLNNDFIIPNNIVLNPSGAAAFSVSLGAGSVGNTGIPTGGGVGATSASSPALTYFSSENFTGQISGHGDILISNDFWGGGGKGITIFSNPNNNYTGHTIINNNGPTYQTFVVGAATAIPAASDLAFGGGSVGTRLGDSKIANKNIGAMDLNGYDVTVHSLSTDLVNSLSVLGITATNNHITNPDIGTGPNSTTTKLSTLTVDSGGDMVNTTFGGNIWDGLPFMTAANNDSGAYAGVQHYWVGTGNAGLAVGLKLAATNKGSLTLSQFGGSNTSINAIYSYSGPTTVNGGTLYVNGNISGSTVTVNTPASGNQAALGGYGTVSSAGGVHIASGAAITPSYEQYASPFNGSIDQAGTATPSTLTVANLTMDAGSSVGILINDGSATAGSGGWSQLNVTGTFTKGAGVATGSPILIDPTGSMAGFNNSATTTWPIATLPGLADSDLTAGLIVLDPADALLTAPILGGGSFALTHSGSALNLVFTPSPTAKNLLWAGATGGSWDVTTTDWVDTNHGGASSSFSEETNVNFADPAAATTVNIQAAGVSPSAVFFANTAHSYLLQGGSIDGGATVSLTGTGTVAFAHANSYSGGTLILNGGTAETRVSGALGSQTITIYKGTWSVTTADQVYANNVSVSGNANSVPATVSAISTTTNLVLNGSIVGPGTFTKSGAGTLTVNGSIGQTGNLAVTQGTLVINGATTYGGATTVASGAAITVNQPAGTIFSLQPTSGLAGNITFGNQVNLGLGTGTFSGGGTVTLDADQSSVQGQGSTVTYNNNIAMNPGNQPTFGIYCGMASTVATITFGGKISGSGDVYFGAGVGGGGGATIYVSGANTYTGKTYITTGGTSILFLGSNNVLPATTVLTFGYQHSGAGFVDLNATTQTIANLDSDASGGGFGGLTSSTPTATLTLNGSVSGKFNALIEGFINLKVALQNNAVLSLSYNGFNGTDTGTYGNTYSGTTTVSGGVLRLTDPLAFSPNTNIVLNGGVLENGGTFTSFTQTLGAGTGLEGGGVGDVEITGGVSGFSAHTAALTVNLNGGGTVVWGSTYFAPSTLVLNQTTADSPLTFQNTLDLAGHAATVSVNTLGASAAATISGNIINSTGTGSFIKAGTGTLILSGTNNYTGGTTVNGGVLQFGALAAIPAAGLTTINTGGAVAVTGAYGTVTDWLNSGKIGAASTGALALTADSNETINLATAGGGAYTNISLGATGSAAYSGVITPLGNTYRLGGGGGTLTVSTALADSGGTTGLAISGPGKVILTNASTFTGNTTIAGGTLQLGDGNTHSGAIGGNVAVATGATLAFANPTAQAFGGAISGGGGVTKSGAGSLSLTGTAATLSYTGPTVVNQGILTLDTAGFIPGTLVDINKGGSPKTGAMVVLKGAAGNLATIISDLNTGYAGGVWNAATGISSTSASPTNNRGIGYLTGADYNSLNPTNSLGLAANDVVLKYTWLGDINLDGTVNAADLRLMDLGYLGGDVGDVNYDGVVNGSDYALAYNSLTAEGNTVLASQVYPMYAAEFGSAFTSQVPEPASLGLLALGGLLAMRRRRR